MDNDVTLHLEGCSLPGGHEGPCDQSDPDARIAATRRGFTAPANLPESLRHVSDRFFVVRMTPWEYEQAKREPFTLLPRDDGTYDAVRSLTPEHVHTLMGADRGA